VLRAWSAYKTQSPASRALIVGSLAVLVLAIFAFARGDAPSAGEEAKEARAEEQEPGYPAELEADVQSMLTGAKNGDRRKGALAILAYPDQFALPGYLTALAKLESARSCRERKDAIAVIEPLDDVRTLAALRRLAAMPRSGCGFLDLEDCYSCIRSDLKRSIETIEAKTLPAGASPTPAP
jgi:hypothetical protein